MEKNIYNFIDTNDSIQKIDVYNSICLIKFYSLIRNILKFKPEKVSVFFVYKFIFFLQILSIPSISIKEEIIKKDELLQVLKEIKKIIYFHTNIDNKTKYLIYFFFTMIFNLLFFNLILLTINKKFKRRTILIIINYLNLTLQNILLYPFFNIYLLIFNCKDKKHIYLNIKCYSNFYHILLIIVSLVGLLFIVINNIINSIFYNQIGGILNQCSITQINTKFHNLESISTLFLYIFGHIIEYYESKNAFRRYIRLIMLLIYILNIIYIQKKVYFYNEIINILYLSGYGMSFWFCFATLIYQSLNLTNITIFVFIGWIIYGFIVYNYIYYRNINSILSKNIFEFETIKELEIYSNNLIYICNCNDFKAKAIINGIIETNEEYFKEFIDVYEKYIYFKNNDNLNKKFNNLIFKVYNILYVLYDYYLNKSEIKNDVLLIYCYFLINYLKNFPYAYYLCSKTKLTGFRYLFYKYLLIEDLKDSYLHRILKNNDSKENIKHIEICSVIKFNYFTDKLKLKIYDAINYQIDYFDILRNNTYSLKSSKMFLKIGSEIINTRLEIKIIWKNIIKLNPFCDEEENDYLLYLENIIQDTDLAEKEDKKYKQIKCIKLSEKNSIYHSLFDKENTSIILVDGYNNKGLIIYNTQNFPTLFNFSQKDINNINIKDLIPSNIATFHNKLIKDAIKYSNLNSIFNNYKNIVLKGKHDCIFNVKLYVRCVPNLSYGLIFITVISKIKDNRLLLLLDDNLKINSLSDNYNQGFLNINTINLKQIIIGKHVACIIPDILKQLEYKNETFTFIKNNIELKSNLYLSTDHFEKYEVLINNILNKIKQGQNSDNNINKLNGTQIFLKGIETIQTLKNYYLRESTKALKKKEESKDFKELFALINYNCNNNNIINIYYRIILIPYLKGKYSSIKVYISQDLMKGNNNEESSKIFLMNNVQGSSKISETENKKNSNKKENENNKGIKIKVFDEEENLLNDEKDNDEEINNKKKNYSNKYSNENNKLPDITNPYFNFQINNDNNNANNLIKEKSVSINSYGTKSSSDSVNFNSLKNKIFKKINPKYIFYMNFNTILYGIISIILVSINNSQTKDKFDKMQIYLEQNKFFNRSKIMISNIFFLVSNIKLVRYEIYTIDECLNSYINNSILSECYSFTINQLHLCMINLNNILADISFYDEEYKKILNEIKEYNVYIFDLISLEKIYVDIPYHLNFILINSMRLYDNYKEYIKNTNEEYNIYFENVINQSYYFALNKEYGLSTKIKQNNAKNKYNNSYIFLIVNLCLFLISISNMMLIIIKIYKIEKKFLKKLIYFNNVNFTNYLKYLQELKKKIHNENEIIEEESEKGSKKDENEGTENAQIKHEKNLIDNTSIITANKFKNSEIKNKRTKNKKKSRKFNKIQQEKKLKIKMMKKYFILYFIFLFIIMLSLFFISIFYYLIEIIFYKKKRKSFFEFDKITDDIQSLYVECNLIYLKIKNEILMYYNFEYSVLSLINIFKSGLLTSYTYEGVTYTIENITTLKYKINISSKESIEVPQIINSLTKLFKNLDKTKESNMLNLYNLFYGDACTTLFSEESYQYVCYALWNSILSQGMEQGIIQFKLEIFNSLDDIEDLNNSKITITEIFSNEKILINIEVFLLYIFSPSFILTDQLLELIREEKVNNINSLFDKIIIIFFVIIIICNFLVFFLIKFIKNNFNDFMNFIAILPIQYLSEDENFYLDVLKLERNLY